MPKTKCQTPKTAKLYKLPRHQCNSDLRTREYLTAHEVNSVGKASRAK